MFFGTKKKFWLTTRNRTSDFRIPRSDALPRGDSESFPLFHARDKTKSIFLYFFTELKTYRLSDSIYKHDAIDITDLSSMEDAHH